MNPKHYRFLVMATLLATLGINLSALATPGPQAQKPNPSSPPKILILYFTPGENSEPDVIASASLTQRKGRNMGMVRALGEMIQENTGGDLFSIRTSVKYPGTINRLIDFAAAEQKRQDRPALVSTHDNLGAYDVIFIGYPIWWYDLPMVMYSFFDKYDLSGKRIIPFSVHNGSRFSSTIETIARLEPKARVLTEGYTVSIQKINAVQDDVARWVRSLKL